MAEPAPLPPLSLQAALKALRPLLGDMPGATEGPSLERVVLGGDPPVIASCTPLEPAGAREVPPASMPLVSAFLDGVQRSRLLGHVAGAPIVFASVAAAVRERLSGQLRTWEAPRVERVLLVSRARLGEARWEELAATGLPVRDTTEGDDPLQLPLHPHALRARALDHVALQRELLERQLAAAWCARESRWLWIDGGIAGNLAVHERAPAFGVVKSHTTLYGSAEAVREVLALRAGERSPAFLVGHRPRRAVASWYLRLRESGGGDPLFGLVRVEVAPPPALLEADHADGESVRAFAAHCDRLSAAILLERAPVSLPDARWHTLAYGVHACEQYLQALLGA
jgi:hypothetical protein